MNKELYAVYSLQKGKSLLKDEILLLLITAWLVPEPESRQLVQWTK